MRARDTVEKLTIIIYYLWKKRGEDFQNIRIVESQSPKIHIVTEEEQKKEIDEIIQESQKIKL